MQKITILGFLAMIAVSSAYLGCGSSGFCGLGSTQDQKEASDRNEMAPSKPLDVPLIMTMEEATSSSPKSHFESLVHGFESEPTVSSTKSEQSAPATPLFKLSPENSVLKRIQSYQTPVSTAKDTIKVTSAQQMPSTSAQHTQNGPADPNQESAPQLVLSLDFKKKPNPSSISEKKEGKKFDCRIICEDGSPLIAHENVVFEYSPYLRNHMIRSVKLDYPPNIIKSLVDLMHDKTVTINRDDFAKTMNAAEFLKINTLIDVVHRSGQQLHSTLAPQTQNAPVVPNQVSTPKLVLSLKVGKDSNRWSKSGQKQGEQLDCRIICEDGSEVIAHENVVVRYSEYLRDNIVHSVKLDYPPNIIESLLKLMDDKIVTIKLADYPKTKNAAKVLQLPKITRCYSL